MNPRAVVRPGGLNVSAIGTGSQAMVMMHGLFGQGRNFAGIAKEVAARADITCWLVDLPNHGGSAWTDVFDLELFAAMVADELVTRGIDDPIVVGHSLGGRVAMHLALDHPREVRGLAVVDVAPGPDAYVGDQAPLITAMQELDLSNLESRSAADAALRPAVPDPRVRGFLLQNLRPGDAGGWSWQVNLPLLADQLQQIRRWPNDHRVYPGPVVWITGSDSPYVRRSDDAVMRRHFPLVQQVRLKEAGHWVHADQPGPFTDTLVWFASKVSPTSRR